MHVPVKLEIPNNFICRSDDEPKQVIFGVQSHLDGSLDKLNKSCKTSITVPVNWTDLETLSTMKAKILLEKLLEMSFIIHYKINLSACSDCRKSGGECWNATDSGENPKRLCKSGKITYLCII